MKQDKISNATNKAINATNNATEASLEFTNKIIEQSKRLRKPSKKVDRIGSMVGSGIGVGLLIISATQLIFGKSLWATGSLVAGTITIGSNIIGYYKRNSNN